MERGSTGSVIVVYDLRRDHSLLRSLLAAMEALPGGTGQRVWEGEWVGGPVGQPVRNFVWFVSLLWLPSWCLLKT